MPTTYTNGLKLPDLGSIDWYNAYKNNIDILDPIVGTVNGVATTYAPISHNHDASEITSGTIDIARLPPAALERLTTVADQTARYALTTSTVQLGDTVKQLDTGIMYLVVDTTKLNSADGYVEYSAGTASKAIADEDGTSIKTGYGKLAGNQTWTGNNTFNSAPSIKGYASIINDSMTLGTVPSSTLYNGYWFKGSTSDLVGSTDIEWYSSGNSAIVTRLTRNTAGASREIAYSFTFPQTGNGTFRVYGDCTPSVTNSVNLGSSSYQWASVYAQTYYYNGTAWGLDKANTWTGANTFTSVLKQRINSVYSQISATDRFAVHEFIGTDSNRIFALNCADRSSGQREMSLIVYDTDGTFKVSGIFRESDGTFSFRSRNNNEINLGTSTNKWKTLNGVNPGALSLPDSANAILTIDTTGWTLNNPVQANVVYINNSNKAPCDGWLYVNIKDATNESAFLYNYTRGYGVTLASNGSQNGLPGRCAGFLPVLKGDVMRVYLNTTNLTDIKFYPCLGNV